MNRDTVSFDQRASWLWDFCRKQKKRCQLQPLGTAFFADFCRVDPLR